MWLHMFLTSAYLVIPTLPSMVHECQRPVANRTVDHVYSAISEGTRLSELNCKLSIFFSPQTDAQLDSLKNNFKFALKWTLKSSYMLRCKAQSSGTALSEPC